MDEKRIAERVARSVISAAPDKVWGRDDDVPKFDGKRAKKLWKLRDGVAAVELDGGDFIVLLGKQAESALSSGARVSIMYYELRRGVKDYAVYPAKNMGAVWYEQPGWKKAFESKTGEKAVETLPFDYQETLMAQGKLPFQFARDALKALTYHGWRKSKEKDGVAVVKRVGGVWVKVWAGDGYRHYLNINANGLPKNLPDEQWDEFFDKTRRVIDDVTKTSVAEIEQKAKEVADIVKGMTPKRKQKTHEDFEWRGEQGPEAYNQWVSDVETTILKILTQHREYYEREQASEWGDKRVSPGEPTSYITSDVLNNHGMEPRWGMSRRESQIKVRAILDSLVKRGKVKKLRGGREIEWEIAR